MNVSAEQVKTLREKTGAGIMDCREALGQSGGDVEKAIDWLRQKGMSQAEKKAGRQTSQGTVSSYIHPGGKVGVLVEVNCETDFVAKTDDFQSLVRDVAHQIAASAPQFVRREDVPKELLDRERAIYEAQARELGKPDTIIPKIVEGKFEKFYAESCLLEQPFIKDETGKITIGDLVKQTIAKLGENIIIRRFARFRLGEDAGL